jgi:hypothetical protein
VSIWDEHRANKQKKETGKIATMEEIESIRVERWRCAEHWMKPWFPEYMKGLFDPSCLSRIADFDAVL